MKTYIFIFSRSITIIFLFIVNTILAQDATYSWRYYRPGNTGIQGDYNEAVWVDANGNPYIGGYHPFFEEGGFAHFIRPQNIWINYSNVDYPVIGNPQNVGSARISEIVPDASGKLWMANWTGIITFTPSLGASSLQRFDATNSLHPGGRTVDIDIAPDSAIWATVISVAWGNGGLIKYNPKTNLWKYWNEGGEHIAVQSKVNGGYLVWIDVGNAMVVYNSDTELFTRLPNTGAKGEIAGLPGKDCVDDKGNLWAFRRGEPGDYNSLEYRDIRGVWHKPSLPYASVTFDTWAFRALGNKRALLVDGIGETWLYNPDTDVWQSMGIWRSGGFTSDVNVDKNGNIWVCGTGGAAVRNPSTGFWQRYRVTNTSQFDYFNNDLTLDPDNNYVYVGANASPGLGGMARFDGERWFCFNQETYGLGENWPFPNDNCHALTYRPSNGNVVVSPLDWLYGIHEWNGEQFNVLMPSGGGEDLVEDSHGRVWSIGEYFDLRYYNGTTWKTVPIAGWGANIQRDLNLPGTVWAAANLEVVRTNGNRRFSRAVSDFAELSPSSDVFTTVAADTGHIAWIGSTAGLIRLNSRNGSYHLFTSENSELPGNIITPYITTPDGRVWFSNFGNDGHQIGLWWFDGNKFGVFPVGEGNLPHAQIRDIEVRIIPDGYELWMSCLSRGIAVLKVTTQMQKNTEEYSKLTRQHNAQHGKQLVADIFPNPVINDNLAVSIKNSQSSLIQFTILNTNGNVIYAEKINAGIAAFTKMIDVSAYAAGVYYLQVTSGKEKLVKKFVKGE